MAIGTRLTVAGAILLSKAIQGKQLKFTRGAYGDAKQGGKLVEPTEEEQDNLSALINERMSLPIYSFKFGDNGDIIVTVKVKNDKVASEFKVAECGLFAEDPDTGAEVLYGYSYEGSDGEKIHSKNSCCVLEYETEFVTTIGNAQDVTCVINIQEKIKAGDGLRRVGDTINVSPGKGLAISEYNNVHLKIASDTQRGGVLITGKDGLYMDDVDTLKLSTASATQKGGIKINNGDGLYVDNDSLKLSTASATQKGGIKINSGGGLYVDNDSLKLSTASKTTKGGVIIGGGLSMSGDTLNAQEYVLPTASTTVKGGVKIGLNLYMTGDSINSSVEPYDDSSLTSRLNQLEINQSNLYMKLDADNQLGITANLLLVEDLKDCDCIDLSQAEAHSVANIAVKNHAANIHEDNPCGLTVGTYVTVVEGYKSSLRKITKITKNVQKTFSGEVDYFFYRVYFDHLDDDPIDDMDTPLTCRTTAAIVNGVAYGPGDHYHAYGDYNEVWKGAEPTSVNVYALNTTAGQESNFELSGQADLTTDGYFSIA